MGSGKRIDNDTSWAVELEKHYNKTGNQPEGKNWKTFSDIRIEIGCGIQKCRRVIAAAKQAGELEVFHGSKVSPTTGTLCRQIWYRPKNKDLVSS